MMRNPVVDGWYTDPESRVYGDTVYIYITRSLSTILIWLLPMILKFLRYITIFLIFLLTKALRRRFGRLL